MADPPAQRGNSWLQGLAAVAVVLWLAIFLSAAALAQALPARPWDRTSAAALAAYIDTLGSHGLDPDDYAPAPLRAAIETGDAGAIESRATLSFELVARDLAQGHVRAGQRGRYFIASDPFEPAQAAGLIDRALGARDVAGTLESLAPRTRQYAALRAALAALPRGPSRERRMLETNLERWRWLPRDLGERHLTVNIPEYTARLVEDGRIVAVHRIIVGKASTPTPQFDTVVTGVIFNPSWTVPQSIIAESVGSLVRRRPAVARARGYTWSSVDGRLRVVQQPGPQNALGQVKLDMPNPFSVYLHDTPSKALFDEERRTFSHGCIRTDRPFDLALLLLADPQWTAPRVAETLATRATLRAALSRPVPAFVVYMTAVAGDDGAIRYLDDPYGLDPAIAAQLAAADSGPALARAAYETECSPG